MHISFHFVTGCPVRRRRHLPEAGHDAESRLRAQRADCGEVNNLPSPFASGAVVTLNTRPATASRARFGLIASAPVNKIKPVRAVKFRNGRREVIRQSLYTVTFYVKTVCPYNQADFVYFADSHFVPFGFGLSC